MIRADSASSAGRMRDDLGLLLLGREAVERLARLAQRGVLQVALLAAGAADEHGVHALGVVAGDRRRALGRLVVGVGVDGEQGEPLERSFAGCRVSHLLDDTPAARPAPWPRTLRRMPALARAVARRSPSPPSSSACDTGDGRELRPPTSDERAGVPTTTSTTTSSLPGVPLDQRAGARRTRRRRPIAPAFALQLPWAPGGADRRPLHVRR